MRWLCIEGAIKCNKAFRLIRMEEYHIRHTELRRNNLNGHGVQQAVGLDSISSDPSLNELE